MLGSNRLRNQIPPKKVILIRLYYVININMLQYYPIQFNVINETTINLIISPKMCNAMD